jgi:ADP-ribosylglycohydrolase
LNKEDKFSIYKTIGKSVFEYLQSLSIDPTEIKLFDRLLKDNIQDLAEEQIRSSGYVLDTLEASVWCLLTTTSYKEAVLKAVNLGQDTDTTGAVTGGLAGLLYGYDSIPLNWKQQLARREDIEDLAERLTAKLAGS